MITHHEQLVEAIQRFDASRLDDTATDAGPTSYADLLTGVLLHDTYHVAQIQLLKRLAPEEP